MIALRLFEPEPAAATRRLDDIVVSAGRRLRPTVAFASYWHLAAERQAMLFRRLRGDQLLTHDAILRDHRFTNAYRSADRVSQYFISEVSSRCEADADDIVFRSLLFKTFNRIETWTRLQDELQEPVRWQSFSFDRYDAALTGMLESGQPIYSNAYMMPNPPYGHRFKHANHLELLRRVMEDGLPQRLALAVSLREVYEELRKVPSFGPFLAFQYAIDLNYTPLLGFDESEFVVAGPGAIDGIRKCFDDVGGYGAADVIRVMADIAEQQFERFGLRFASLWGRALQLIDCQNLFCEVDKYSRIAHPHLNGESGRSRIKQRYALSKGALPTYTFPARWKLDAALPFGDVTKLEF